MNIKDWFKANNARKVGILLGSAVILIVVIVCVSSKVGVLQALATEDFVAVTEVIETPVYTPEVVKEDKSDTAFTAINTSPPASIEGETVETVEVVELDEANELVETVETPSLLDGYSIEDIEVATKHAKSTVNIRSLPDTVEAAKVLGQLSQNDKVIVNGKTSDGKWFRLQTIKGTEVTETTFVSSKYLVDSKVTASKPTSTGGSVATQPATPSTPQIPNLDSDGGDWGSWAGDGVEIITTDPNAGGNLGGGAWE